MVEMQQDTNSRELRLLSLLYWFLSILTDANGHTAINRKGSSNSRKYVSKAVEYIEKNYSRKVCISEISNFIGIDRSYLYSTFKQHLNISPQEFLINYRMNKACELMSNKALFIGDIARSVGYEDQLLFSKEFKKLKGFSPREYRKLYIK